MADRKLTLDIFARDRNARRTLEGIADAADDAGDELEDLSHETAGLDREMAKATRSADALRKAFAKTGDKGLLKDLRAAERDVKQFTTIQKKLADDGAKGFTAKFVASIGPIMAKAPLGPAIGAPLVAAAAAAAPVIAATLTAGIVGAFGAGAAGAGVALAIADDPRIQAAGKRLGLTIRTSLSDAAQPFRAETLAAIGDIGREFTQLQPLIRGVFADSARFVRPLTAGLTGALRELGPGIAAAVAKAGPVIDVIARKLPELGRTFSNQIEMIAGGSEEAADALSAMFTAIQIGVSTIGPSIRALTEVFGLLDKAGLLTGFVGIADKMGLFDTNAKKMTSRTTEVVGALDQVDAAAAAAAHDIGILASSVRDLGEANRSAVGSEISFEEAIDAASAAAKENGKTLDTNTAKGRANMSALKDLADQTVSHAEQTRNATHSQDLANAAMQRGYTKFINAAIAMGKSKAEAKQLAAAMGLIPPGKTITIKYPTMSAAEIKARALARAINTIDTYKEILIVQRLAVKGQRITGVTGRGGHLEGLATGGPAQPHRTYVVGERGPELLSMGSTGGHVTPNHRLPAAGMSPASFRSAMEGMAVVMNGQVVGRIEAQRADLLRRGG